MTTTLREGLKNKLTAKELNQAPRSYDLIGDIAVLEIGPLLQKKEKLIAKTLLSLHTGIKVVCKKAGEHTGVYRTRKLTILAGDNRKETVHKENNVRLKLDIEQCYFSPRLATERLRIAKQVKKNEHVLVMFSGVGPYALVIAKNSCPKLVVGIEKNPAAHAYALQNKLLNKASPVTFYKGDVKKVIPPLHQTFNRIIMPLPKGAENFLGIALGAAKKGAFVHFYDFQHQDELGKAREKVERACSAAGKRCKILNVVKCGQYSPNKFRVCVDFRVVQSSLRNG